MDIVISNEPPSEQNNEPASSRSLSNALTSDNKHKWYRFVQPLHTRLEALDKILYYLVLPRSIVNYDDIYDNTSLDKTKLATREKVEDLVFVTTNHTLSGKFKVRSKESIRGCGGFYEDDSSSKVNDCDYNIILDIPAEYMNCEHVFHIESTQQTTRKRKCYYKVKFTEEANNDKEFVKLWKCQRLDCSHQSDTVLCPYVLNSALLQHEFLNELREALQDNLQIETVCMKIRGPAVSIALKIPDVHHHSLKPKFTLDLAIAITPDISWRFWDDCFKNIYNDCKPHLVPSGDFWKLSFVEYETTGIRHLDPWVKQIYFKAKAVRDDVQPEFPTYPIKQAALHSEYEIELLKYRQTPFIEILCVKYVFDYILERTMDDTFDNYFYLGDQLDCLRVVLLLM